MSSWRRHLVAGHVVPALHAWGKAAGHPVNVASPMRWGGLSVARGSKVHCHAVSGDVEIMEGATVGQDVRLGPRVRLGPGSTVVEAAQLYDCVIGEAVRVEIGSLVAHLSAGARSWIGAETLCCGRGEGRIVLGEDAYVGFRCLLDWTGGLTIGSSVQISGPSSAFWTHSSLEQAAAGLTYESSEGRFEAPIVIGDHAYIGGNCTIYPGVTIGEYAVVLPNSAVSEDVAPHTMVGGVPAKVVREIAVRTH